MEEEKKDQEEEMKGDPEDLIQEYQEYLKAKSDQAMEVDEKYEQSGLEEKNVIVPTFDQNLEKFDYLEQKMVIRELFQQWLADEKEHDKSLELFAKFKNQTQQVTSALCE